MIHDKLHQRAFSGATVADIIPENAEVAITRSAVTEKELHYRYRDISAKYQDVDNAIGSAGVQEGIEALQ